MYTKNTPQDYEPPLFAKADEINSNWFDDQPLYERAGRMSTPYHKLGISIRVRATQPNKHENVLKATLSNAAGENPVDLPSATQEEIMEVDTTTPASHAEQPASNAFAKRQDAPPLRKHSVRSIRNRLDGQHSSFVDVGGSDVNTARAGPQPANVVRDTQEMPHGSPMQIPARLQIRRPKRSHGFREGGMADTHSQITQATEATHATGTTGAMAPNRSKKRRKISKAHHGISHREVRPNM